MIPTKRWMRFLLTISLSALLLGLAGCSSDDGASGSSANAQPQADLQADADQAAADSGLTGFTDVTTANAGTVVDEGVAAIDRIIEGVEADNNITDPTGLSAPANGLLQDAVRKALTSFGLRAAALGAEDGTRFVTNTFTLSGTSDCAGGGTVTASGTVVVVDNSTETSTSGSISMQNVQLVFDACNNGSDPHTLWGTVVGNGTETINVALNAARTGGTFSLTVDTFIDGGIAFSDGSSNFNLAFSEGLVGSTTGTFDSSVTFTYDTFSFTATVTANGITCTATVTSEAEADNPTWICT